MAELTIEETVTTATEVYRETTIIELLPIDFSSIEMLQQQGGFTLFMKGGAIDIPIGYEVWAEIPQSLQVKQVTAAGNFLNAACSIVVDLFIVPYGHTTALSDGIPAIYRPTLSNNNWWRDNAIEAHWPTAYQPLTKGNFIVAKVLSNSGCKSLALSFTGTKVAS